MRVRNRRLLAMLASGVVLLGGGVTTLAAWQEDQFVGGPVTLSSFDVQTSLDDSQWDDASTQASPKSLVLAINGALSNVKLTPNGVVTGWVGLRAAPKSLGATVQMSTVSVNTGTEDKGLLSALASDGTPAVTYEAVAGVSRTDCQSNTLGSGTSLANPGSQLGVTVSGSSFTLLPGTDTAAGASVGVCFRLKLANNLSQVLGGAKISPVWKFHATSLES